MLKELLGRLPLITLELPDLTRGEDSNDPRPILRLELLRRIHNNEPNWPSAVY